MFALHQKDAYKIGHIHQYPEGTEEIYSNFTARSGRLSNIPGTKGIYFVGLQYFIRDYLIKEWNESFFYRPKEIVVEKYRRRVSAILGYEINVSHISELHDLGYLPLKIKALPEGSFVPYGVPMLTIKNTNPKFYWLTNMIESVLSSELFQPITTLTTTMEYRKLFKEYADKTGIDKSFINIQGHDFSYRGMPGRHAASISGFAALASGNMGTDCISAIDIAEDYYEADSYKEYIGISVPATEHSVMCSGSKEEELNTYKRLLTETYPSGIVSIVSDTWDFWNVVTNYLPSIKDIIEKREGKLVIRPDSGDPVDIICGTNPYSLEKENIDNNLITPDERGLIECLWNTFGGTINSKGYKELNPKIGAIYGDSITYSRAKEILERLEQKGFASNCIVFGIGSYTYQMITRDTHGMAVKSTHAVINGEDTPIFKDPKTDNGVKKSSRGYLLVTTNENGEYKLEDNVSRRQEKHGCLEVKFSNGKEFNTTSLKEIRDRCRL